MEVVLAAVISAVVALITAGITALISWSQIRREHIKWITDIKAEQYVELFKSRLIAYPEILSAIGELSHRASAQLTPDKANSIGKKINSWLYSTGGLLASKETRGALLGLREICFSWREGKLEGELHEQMYTFRNYAILLLRRDLDIKGLESYDFNNLRSVLDELKEEVSLIK